MNVFIARGVTSNLGCTLVPIFQRNGTPVFATTRGTDPQKIARLTSLGVKFVSDNEAMSMFNLSTRGLWLIRETQPYLAEITKKIPVLTISSANILDYHLGKQTKESLTPDQVKNIELREAGTSNIIAGFFIDDLPAPSWASVGMHGETTSKLFSPDMIIDEKFWTRSYCVTPKSDLCRAILSWTANTNYFKHHHIYSKYVYARWQLRSLAGFPISGNFKAPFAYEDNVKQACINAPKLSIYAQRALQHYEKIAADNGADVGHCSNHVIKVTEAAVEATRYSIANQLLSTYYPNDVVLRVEVACILHEAFDSKIWKKNLDVYESQTILFNILDKVFDGYTGYRQTCDISEPCEVAEDIYYMIDYCSTAKWGDRLPSRFHKYQLIPRWADRTESIGVIGIARTLLYSKSIPGYPLCRNESDFPTTFEELDRVSPVQRFINYTNGQKSPSAFDHILDKLVHIKASPECLPYFKQIFDSGSQIVRQFAIDFTVKHNRKFDIDWIINNLDSTVYAKEIEALRKIPNDPWIMRSKL